jgi:hypothetical protein
MWRVLCFTIVSLLSLCLPVFISTGDQMPLPSLGGFWPLGQASRLRGLLIFEKSRRMAVHWDNGLFELWDTEGGRRLGRQQMPRPIAWCVTSPDQETIVSGDTMYVAGEHRPAEAGLKHPFVPTVCVWDAKTGKPIHFVGVPQADGLSSNPEWYARWLDNTRVLIVRLLRENPVRSASWLKLIVIDTRTGKVIKASEDFANVGEHLLLSPDCKTALVKADNYVRRTKES